MSLITKLYHFLKLSENHQLKLETSKEMFIAILSEHVGKDGNTSGDIFASARIDYKGQIGQSGFYLRRRRTLRNHTRYFCRAEGYFREEPGRLIIDITFKNFTPLIWLFLILLFFFSGASIVMLIIALISLDSNNISRGIFNIFTTLMLFGIVSVIVRIVSGNTIRKMKHEMENNFHRYLTT